MFTSDLARTVRTLAFGLCFATLVGCGGGGGEAPAPGPNVTVAAGGTVTSDDGKLRLVVAPNSASADAAITLRAAAPGPLLAEPGYIPDSAYTVQGRDLEFNPPATWELASPLATAAAQQGRQSALATVVGGGDVDVEGLCLPAAGSGARSVWVRGGTCPAGCTALRAPGSPAPAGRTLCAPPDDMQVGLREVSCPAGTVDATDEPAWSAWATTNTARVCVRAAATAAPVLGTSLGTATTSCGTRPGKFVCNPPKVTSGLNIGLFFPVGAPKNVTLGFRSNLNDAVDPDRFVRGAWTIRVADGATGKLYFVPKAEEVAGADTGDGGLQIREHKVVTPSSGGLALIALASTVVWEAGQPFYTGGVADTVTTAAPAVIDYKWNDPPVRYFRAKAWNKAGNVAYSSFLRISRLSPTGPVVASFVAAPNALPPGGGNSVLTWDVNGADTVNIQPDIGVVAASGSSSRSVQQTTTFTLSALNGFGQTATQSVIVTVAADTTPPAVTLTSSAAAVVVPGSVALTATASDDIGVTKVEFLRGVTVLATDFTAPYQHSLALGAADVGMVTIRARAYDAAGNVSPFSAVTLNVTEPPGSGDTYASPTGVDAGNATCAQATPCLTIAKAASLAQANKTVWLANGLYTTATQPVPITIPAGLTVRAVNAGLARVSQGIVLQGSGSVIGVVLPRDGLFESGYIQATNGTVLIDGVRVTGTASITSGVAAPIALSGTVQATMTPGAIADYADQLAPAGQGKATYATLAGTSRLTVSGGTFGGAALGGADSANGSVGRGAFILSDDSRLDLDGVVLNVDSSGVAMQGATTQLFMTGSTLNSNLNTGSGAGVHAARGTPQITLTNSSITGFANSYSASSAGIAVGLFAQPGVAATISGSAATLRGNDAGILVQDMGTTPTSLTLAASNLTVSASTYGGIVCRAACALDIAGGAVSDNGTSGAFTGFGTFLGGLWLGETTKTYTLKLRNVLVTDNRSALTGNTNVPDNSGVTLRGNAGSNFDLGTGASPGGNVFTGNTTGSQTAGLNVAAAPGITVGAVGNTFIAGVQGADALGKYQLGTAPCGSSACSLASGAGANYRITGGALRLAE